MFANLGFAAVLQSTYYPRAGREALWICTTATLQQRSPSEASFLSYLTIQLTCHPGRNRFQQDQHPKQPHRTAARMLDRGDVAKHETGISALSGDPDVIYGIPFPVALGCLARQIPTACFKANNAQKRKSPYQPVVRGFVTCSCCFI
ncbi:hypothetical protein Anapl_05705 [Anas platyrhynchos]|uniref:Uncharacterized protein n=1 Tax=Anas platyrhynchos TaxID=8839 RepID=R0LUJ0_ANAPL|nr:hypothetical protein Anapl_05705 [Anas platyrhynchos]